MLKRNKTTIKKLSFLAIIVLIVLAFLFSTLQMQLQNPSPKMSAAPENKYAQTLIVAADEDYQPYSFYGEDGQPVGYDVELIYRLANAMKVNVEVRLMNWTEASDAVSQGEADILMGLDYNVDSLKNYQLSMPLHNDPFVAFGKEKFQSIDDLFGKKLATLDNSGSFAAFLSPYHLDENTTTYSSYTEAFQSVADGENDYAIAMYSVGRRTTAKLNNSSIHAAGPTLAGNYLCIGVNQRNTELIDKLNRAIIQLKKDGVMDELNDKWLGKYVEVISFKDLILAHLTSIAVSVTCLIMALVIFYVFVTRQLSRSAEREYEITKKILQYQQLLTEATKGLYENIYELDITHNCAGGESTMEYFESLGIPGNTPFDMALRTIADKQIKPEFIKGYLETFSPEHVTAAYQQGVDSLSYDFMLTSDGSHYYWMRITARIFFWSEDQSIRMITYRQNIDAEKKKEQLMAERMQQDSLTRLYNKLTTEQLIGQVLSSKPEQTHAFIMLDIDNFKSVNDTLGHAFGDYVITQFAEELRYQTEAWDIVGRIGGDEFALFLPIPDRPWLESKITSIVEHVSKELRVGEKSCRSSASVGIALYPDNGTSFDELYQKADMALYQVKDNGKNGYRIYGE